MVYIIKVLFMRVGDNISRKDRLGVSLEEQNIEVPDHPILRSSHVVIRYLILSISVLL